MTKSDLPDLTIFELQELLRSREVSPREVIETLHERIESLDPQIDAYLSRDLAAALAAADVADVDERSLMGGGITKNVVRPVTLSYCSNPAAA